jgi:hypothetical protein
MCHGSVQNNLANQTIWSTTPLHAGAALWVCGLRIPVTPISTSRADDRQPARTSFLFDVRALLLLLANGFFQRSAGVYVYFYTQGRRCLPLLGNGSIHQCVCINPHASRITTSPHHYSHFLSATCTERVECDWQASS